nr:hypothetical protein HUO10_003411 [Paraburkholderia busanensis]
MKIAHSISSIALRVAGVACVTCAAAVSTPGVAGATGMPYPSTPLPGYAQDELQRIVDAATGSMPQARQPEPDSKFETEEGQSVVTPQREEAEPQASTYRDARPSKSRRRKRHHYV